jgi:hypothetical protein
MNIKIRSVRLIIAFVLIVLISGCNFTTNKVESTVPPAQPQIAPTNPPVESPTQTQIPPTIAPESTAEATSEPEIVHKDLPGSPIGNKNTYQTVHDQVDENTASQKQAFGGDDFNNGKFERPFDQSMNYLPQADLVNIQLNREDPLWVYVLFKVNKPFSDNPGVNSNFMIEIDTDLDSRGDLLILTGLPKDAKWSTASVKVLSNPDLNVGGQKVVKPDPKLNEGRGYFEEVFNDGKGKDPDLAWSRLSSVDPTIAEIAFKNTLTGGEKGKFIWLPWSDAGMQDWSLFEFNDHFTFMQAGSPLKEYTDFYPLKALWGIDNTCRIPSGFTPTGPMPGLCPNYDPVSTRSDKPQDSCKPCGPTAGGCC